MHLPHLSRVLKIIPASFRTHNNLHGGLLDYVGIKNNTHATFELTPIKQRPPTIRVLKKIPASIGEHTNIYRAHSRTTQVLKLIPTWYQDLRPHAFAPPLTGIKNNTRIILKHLSNHCTPDLSSTGIKKRSPQHIVDTHFRRRTRSHFRGY